LPDLAVLVEPLLVVRRVLREQCVILHRRLLAIVRDDEVCRRLITTPGVGPVVALTYRATVRSAPDRLSPPSPSSVTTFATGHPGRHRSRR
jgi:transposase